MKKRFPSILIIVGSSFAILLLLSFFLPSKINPWWYLQNNGIKQSLHESRDPIFLPGGSYLSSSSFTIFKGWKDAYQVRYNNHGPNQPTEAVYMLQFSRQSLMPPTSGGLDSKHITADRSLAISTTCNSIDTAAHIRYCHSSDYGFVIRDMDTAGKKIFVAAEIFNPIPNTDHINKSRVPSAQDIEVRVIKSIIPVATHEAELKYFKYDGEN
jgi:hypothetical protein